jgi:hypothetical protein
MAKHKSWMAAAATVAALAALAAQGCGQEDAQGNLGLGGASSCAPGALLACACPDLSIGQQQCAMDGQSLGACMCGPMAGAAGTGLAGVGSSAAGSGAGTDTGTAGNGGAGAGAGTSGAGAAGTAAGGDPDAGLDGGGSEDASTTPPGEEVPDIEHCAPASSWDPAWTEFEDEVLRLVNVNRAKGWNCDAEGQFGATTDPSGGNPQTRMDAAGYSGVTWGENIAKGQSTPAEVVAGWMDSDGHCANIMNPMFTEIGVGFYEGTQTNQYYNENLYWTQNFGAPCTQSWCM